MAPTDLQQALHQGHRVYGTHIASTSPIWPAVLKNSGLDFVFIDTEHVPIDRDQLSWMCRAYEGIGLPPIVRIPAPDPYQACMALDAGAAGIIAPYVETAEEARALRGAVKLRPLKGRRLAETLGGNAPAEPLQGYLAARNTGKLLILNIESKPAMEALDEILEVPDIDAVLVGPHDLSCSLDVPERYPDPCMDAAIREIIGKARAKNVGAGIHVFYGDIDQEIEWLRAGANFVIHGSDALLFAETLRRDVSRIRGAMGDGESGQASEEVI